MSAERDVLSVYRALVMRHRVGDVFDATVTATTDSSFYAALDAPFVETCTPVARLESDYFELDRLGIRLSGFRTGRSFTLGDRLRLRVEEVSLSRREILAAPEDLPAQGQGKPATRGRGKKPKTQSKGESPRPSGGRGKSKSGEKSKRRPSGARDERATGKTGRTSTKKASGKKKRTR